MTEKLKLYPVTLHLTVMVAADSEDGAETAARGQLRDIFETELTENWEFLSGPEIQTISELNGAGYGEWQYALPWGRNNEELNCWQILEDQ